MLFEGEPRYLAHTAPPNARNPGWGTARCVCSPLIIAPPRTLFMLCLSCLMLFILGCLGS